MSEVDGSTARLITPGSAFEQAAGSANSDMPRTLPEAEAEITRLRRELQSQEQQIEKLKSDQQHYQIAFDHAPIMIWVKDDKNNILRNNRAAANITGFKQSDSGETSTWDLYPDEARKYYDDDLSVIHSGNAKLGIVELLETPQGKIWVQTDKVPWFDEDQNVKGVVVLVTDITQRRQQELALENQQRLDSLGRLAGGIAHDFNNLLSAIFGNISLALNAYSNGHNPVHYLTSSLSAHSRAIALTTRLLTFSRGGAPVLKSTSIGTLIAETARLCLTGSTARCDLKLAAELMQCEVDSGQISQVLQSLIVNAEQAMLEGGEITISAENIELQPLEIARLACSDQIPPSAKKYVKVAVHDTGSGIPEHIVGKIFDPFFTTKNNATGLGLSTSYSIVKRHDGFIDVTSSKKSGTTITMYLPAEASPAAFSYSAPPQACAAVKGKVLVMDDEVYICELLSDLLAAGGFTAVTALNSSVAEQYFEDALKLGEKFDAAILDLTLKSGDGGKEVVKRLKILDPDLKAIVSSGYADNETMAQPALFGFDGVISKPYTPQQLYDLLRELLPTKK